MKPWCIKFGGGLFFALSLCLGAAVAHGQSLAEPFAAIDAELESLQMAMAEQHLSALTAPASETPAAMYLRGKLAFFQGDYATAYAHFLAAIGASKTELDWKNWRDRAHATMAVLSARQAELGRHGHFQIAYTDLRDALLAGRADDILNRQLDALQAVFGDKPDMPVRVYILASVSDFAAMSGLSIDRIETTATVAMSRYNRIMILSPRIISGGYPWLDTLAHELTHVFITRLSRNRAPIWLQEGVAKYYEAAWRNLIPGELSPEEAFLLERAATERRLIPFRRFHPSVSFMPSQEDAVLAYAQALSFMQFVNTHAADENWMAALLREMADGHSLESLLAKTTRADMRKLRMWWEKEVTAKHLTPRTIAPFLKKRFVAGAQSRDIPDREFYDTEVRRQLRLGDLLRLRGHLREALEKYEAAAEENRVAAPDIAQRIAGCYIDLHQLDHAVDFLAPLIRLYPFQAVLHLQLAEARLRQDKAQEAILSLLQTIAIDPFQSQVHCRLSEAYRRIGDVNNAATAEAHCQLLQRAPGK